MSISVCINRQWNACALTGCALGANPSAEEQDEGLEEGAIQVNNVVHSFRLQSTAFDRKSFLLYLKVSMIVFGWRERSHSSFRDT